MHGGRAGGRRWGGPAFIHQSQQPGPPSLRLSRRVRPTHTFATMLHALIRRRPLRKCDVVRRCCISTAATSAPKPPYTTLDVVQWLRAERAESVKALDISQLLGGSMGETFVFATGRSRVHMLRLAKAVRHEFKHRGVLTFGEPPAIEGADAADDWMLVDGGSVVVSVMARAARERLALERHWEDQGAKPIELPPPPDEPAEPLPIPAAVRSVAPGAAHRSTASEEDTPTEDVYHESGPDELEMDEDEYEYYDEYADGEYEYYGEHYDGEYADDDYRYADDDYCVDDGDSGGSGPAPASTPAGLDASASRLPPAPASGPTRGGS